MPAAGHRKTGREADLGGSGAHAGAAKTTAGQRPEKDSRGTLRITVEQGVELERCIPCDGHWRIFYERTFE